MKNDQQILPRILRCQSAPAYLGMCRAEFNKTVRPFVKEIPVGTRGVGFDRYELDAWADAYIAENAIQKSDKKINVSTAARKRAEEQRHEHAETEFEKALALIRRKR